MFLQQQHMLVYSLVLFIYKFQLILAKQQSPRTLQTLSASLAFKFFIYPVCPSLSSFGNAWKAKWKVFNWDLLKKFLRHISLDMAEGGKNQRQLRFGPGVLAKCAILVYLHTWPVTFCCAIDYVYNNCVLFAKTE